MADAIVSKTENIEEATGYENAVVVSDSEAEAVEQCNLLFHLRFAKMDDLVDLDEAAEIHNYLNEILEINNIFAERFVEMGADYETASNRMESEKSALKADYDKLMKINERQNKLIHKLTAENAVYKSIFRKANANVKAMISLFENAGDGEDSGIDEREKDENDVIETGNEADAEESAAESQIEEVETIQPSGGQNSNAVNNEGNQPIEPLAENPENRNDAERENDSENDVMVIEDNVNQVSADTSVANVKPVARAVTSSNVAAVAAPVLNNENANNENEGEVAEDVQEASTSGVFSCTMCPATFDRKPLLNRHKAEAHGIKRKMKMKRRSAGKKHEYLFKSFIVL